MASVIRGSDNFDSGYMLGVGQAWQNVKASRALDTDYTNSTGKPIMVQVGGINAGTSNAIQPVVGGVSLPMAQSSAANFRSTAVFIVPVGATYRVNNVSGATLDSWAELR